MSNEYANVFEMPCVIEVIKKAQETIKSLTGKKVLLFPTTAEHAFVEPAKRRLRQLTEVEFGIPWEKIISPSQRREVVYARFFYAWVCIKIFKQTLKQTGEELGGRDHTTVINALVTLKGHLEKGNSWGQKLTLFINQYNGAA